MEEIPRPAPAGRIMENKIKMFFFFSFPHRVSYMSGRVARERGEQQKSSTFRQSGAILFITYNRLMQSPF